MYPPCRCFHSYCACLVTQSCPTLCEPMDCSPPGSSVHGDSLGQNTGVGSLSLLQGIYPTQGWKPGLPHCRRILYQVSHQRNPRIPEWVAYPFPRRSSWSRNQARVSCIAGRFFTNWVIREALWPWKITNAQKYIAVFLSIIKQIKKFCSTDKIG